MKVVLTILLTTGVLLGVCTALSLQRKESDEWERDLSLRSVPLLVVRDDNNNNSSWIDRHILPVAIGAGVGLLIILCVAVSLVILCVCLMCRKNSDSKPKEHQRLLHNGYSNPQRYARKEQGVVEAMNRQRKEKETMEKQKADETMSYFLRNNPQYQYVGDLSDLGSRMQKHWYRVMGSEGEKRQNLLLTTTPVSQKCPLKLDSSTVKGINKLVKELRKHPYLQTILTVEFLGAQQQLVVVQPFHEGGSLKDTIYRATPITDWSNKYSRRSRGLTIDKVRLYGRQILEAMSFLYSKGFPILGHVQSGNVFIVGDVCRVGGYENTLLGYKTRLYKMCKEFPERIDVVMFGHLLFEMCCGYELTHLRPEDPDYKIVKKEEVKEILQFIFEEDFPNDIDTIRKHEFFSVTLPKLEHFDPDTVKISGSMEHVLEKVRKGKPREQKVTKLKKEVTPPPPPPPPQDTTVATPTAMDSPKKSAGPESRPGTGDSAGDQSGDSKEGKRKGRSKFGKKRKKETGGDEGGAEDKTPITQPPSEELA